MDHWLREICEISDANDLHYEQWMAKRAELDARAGPDPIYKTTAEQPSAAARMDAATEARWNEWCQAHIQRALAVQPLFSKAQKLVIADVISRLRAEWRREIAEAVGSLRADLTVQTAIAKGEIAEIKGKRDAA